MSRYEEKVYRVSKGKGGPSIAEMKNQLARLKQDLEQFQGRGAGAAVQSSLKSRIRELQTSLSEAEAAQARRQQARRAEDDDDDGPRRPQVQATSSRFPPRGTTGGS